MKSLRRSLLSGSLLICSLILMACGQTSASPTVTPPAATPTIAAISSPVPATATPIATVETLPTAAATVTVFASPTVQAATPPTQPANGPGGLTYSHQSVTENVYGTGDEQYYLFAPADPAPKSAPLIIFVHGYTDLTPEKSLPWINHLVKRGNLVIYPVYQSSINSTGENFTTSATKAVKAGLEQLQTNSVKPELDKVSFLGYSAGGIVASNLVTLSESSGLPVPKALFLVAPGGSVGLGLTAGSLKLEVPGLNLTEAAILGKIAPATKMLILTGDRDIIVGDRAAKFIWQNTAQIPPTNKEFIRLNSDNHGQPALIADHGVGNRLKPDALNFYGSWKLFDALQNCTLNNKDCEVAFGDTPAQRYMGKWTDGQPVKELTIIKNP